MNLDQLFHNEQYKTLRQDWKFDYPAVTLAKAAQEQRAYRLERVKVWEKKKAQLLVKIKKTGVSLKESVSEKMSTANYSTRAVGRSGITIQVDETMQEDMDEIMGKIKLHKELAGVYDAWMQILFANKSKLLELNHGDWMFFFGKV